jgi:hypothetical protein
VGDPFTSVAVAAIYRRVWIAWATTNGRTRIKAFDVGRAPDYAVTPGPTVTLPDTGQFQGNIKLGASGNKVVVAYDANSHTFARVSTDGGVSFGPRRRLLVGIFGGDLSTGPHSAAIRGGRAVVHAAEFGGFKDLSTDSHRFTSTNDGATWNRVRRYSDGARMGDISVVNGRARLVEAWDQRTSQAARQRLWFHRET